MFKQLKFNPCCKSSKPYKKYFLAALAILQIIILVSLIYPEFGGKKSNLPTKIILQSSAQPLMQSEEILEPKTQENSAIENTVIKRTSQENSVEISENDSVRYDKKWSQPYGKVKFTSQYEYGDREETYDIYKVGTFTSGKYKGGNLLNIFYSEYGLSAKDDISEKRRVARYMQIGKKFVFLSKISDDAGKFTKENLSKKLGWNIEDDNNFTIPDLEYNQIKYGMKNNKFTVLNSVGEEVGLLDEKKLYPIFNYLDHGHKTIVYTTKPEFTPKKSVPYYDAQDDGGTVVKSCKGEECFLANAFLVFRPDGTFLKYSYAPYIQVQYGSEQDEKDIFIKWNDGGESSTSEYIGSNSNTFDYGAIDSDNSLPPSFAKRVADFHNSILSPSIAKDLQRIGKIKNGQAQGEIIYGFKDKNHPLYKEIYDGYSKAYDDINKGGGTASFPKKTYQEMLNSKPIIVWQDPFGRYMSFSREDILVLVAEPIIYLYPTKKQKISVELTLQKPIFASNPKYKNGWKVIADTDGKITNIADNKNYPYLFWESPIYNQPTRPEGFVVKQSEITSFFNQILPKLGLNKKESQDFIKAWQPKLTKAPYYFITFIDNDMIDKIAPLKIDPKPDTVIRILMDFKPLDQPISAPILQLPKVPPRVGFTVIEWGGLQR